MTYSSSFPLWLKYSLYNSCYSELNDTVVEAQLRIRQIPPLLPKEDAVERYMRANNRLLILVII